MTRIRRILVFVILGAGFLGFFAFVLSPRGRKPSKVYIKSNLLIVERRLKNGALDKPKPYVIIGTTWSPAAKAPVSGPNPLNPSERIDYGYFFDWEGRKPQGHDVFNYWIKSEFLAHYKEDISLMHKMNITTVRVYNDFGDDPKAFNAILDELFENNIMVIVTLNLSKDEIVPNAQTHKLDIRHDAALLKVVDNYKHHPAILMWSIGNEWNFNKYYGNVSDLKSAIQLTQKIAQIVKRKDSFHPVSSCLGDAIVIDAANPCKPPEEAGVAYILEHCPDIEIWGINVYRGTSFHGIFEQWKNISDKPFYISEFGTDSFNTASFMKFKPDDPCDYRITQCTGTIDEDLQANTDLGLWKEIETHLAVLNPGQLCQGGLTHEFKDEIWKVGSYHVGLGGLIDYKSGEHSFDEYNCEGVSIGASHPDHVANEEYFGMVDANLKPKKAYYVLRDEFAKLNRMLSLP